MQEQVSSREDKKEEPALLSSVFPLPSFNRSQQLQLLEQPDLLYGIEFLGLQTS